MEVIANDFKCTHLTEDVMPPNILMVLSENTI